MVKRGPCRHCGVTSTPLWRNGPPEKPVLCNACGSRWRTKGSLTNYTPLIARAEPDPDDCKVSSVRTGIVNKSKEVKLAKRRKNHNNDVVGGDPYNYSHSYRKFMDDDKSNRSSSGSGVSNSESFGPFSSTVGSDSTGPDQSIVCDTIVSSKNKTFTNHSEPSPIEKFAQELYTIWQERQIYCSGSPEEELLYESDTPMVSVEIGHGSVLIRHPSEIAHDEDSEASSLSADIKNYPRNDAHLPPATLSAHTENKAATFKAPRTTKSEKFSGQLAMNGEKIYRTEVASVHEIQRLLGRRDSPLCAIDLNEIVNLEEFAAQFTTQEQQQLLKYLPVSDVERYPIRLKSLFDDPQFRQSLLSFQHLLAEGVFDLSFPDIEPDSCRNLRRFALSNLLKSNWVELYNLLQKSKNGAAGSHVTGSNVMEVAQKSHKTETKLLPKNSSSVKMKPRNQTKEFLNLENTSENSNPLISHPLRYTGTENG